jgi:hypothetical protein
VGRLVAIDAFPLKEMRARLTELAEETHVALIDARLLDYYRSLECENIHITLREEAARSWDDIKSGDLLSVAKLKVAREITSYFYRSDRSARK